jgi:transcriptional regulator with XRE-family HTH domain
MAHGRPLKPLDPTAGAAAALGARVRSRRLEENLTLAALGALAGYSPQHISELERARASVTRQCVTALDAALGANGELLELLRPAVTERAFAAQDRAAARGGATMDDVDPTNRRGLLGASASAALGVAGVAAAPVAARDVDPELPEHWGGGLLRLLGRYDETHGPRDVLDTVRRELRVIAERADARGGALGRPGGLAGRGLRRRT